MIRGKLYQFLQWRGIEVPDFRVVETVDQFMTAAGELNYPRQSDLLQTICLQRQSWIQNISKPY